MRMTRLVVLIACSTQGETVQPYTLGSFPPGRDRGDSQGCERFYRAVAGEPVLALQRRHERRLRRLSDADKRLQGAPAYPPRLVPERFPEGARERPVAGLSQSLRRVSPDIPDLIAE